MRTPTRAAFLALVLLSACSEHAALTLTPGQQKKVEAAIVTEAHPQRTVGATIEDQVRLIGVDIDKAEVAPGQTFTVTYYIEALSDSMGDNNLFVHLQGRKNDRKAWMNLDHHPVEGLLPLRDLKKGQIVKDVQRVTVSPDFSYGEAKIYWGLWRGEYRLKIANADKAPHDDEGRVIAGSILIKGPRPELPEASAIRIEGEAAKPLTIDGKLDEPAWQQAVWTKPFVAPNGGDGAAPSTKAAFLWTPTTLYVGVVAEDDDVWTDFKDRDSNTWEQEVVEVFLDPDGDRKDYLELQVTPANVVFDARFAAHRSDLAAARAWNMPGLETGAHVDGTLNVRDDKDKGFSIEMAIPVAEAPGAPHNPIAAGDVWRANLFRWDWPKGGKQAAAAFSPPVVPDFHALDKFGRIRFVDPKAATPPASAPGPMSAQSAAVGAPATSAQGSAQTPPSVKR